MKHDSSFVLQVGPDVLDKIFEYTEHVVPLGLTCKATKAVGEYWAATRICLRRLPIAERIARQRHWQIRANVLVRGIHDRYVRLAVLPWDRPPAVSAEVRRIDEQLFAAIDEKRRVIWQLNATQGAVDLQSLRPNNGAVRGP